MSQPPPSPSVKVNAIVYPANPKRHRKISAPPQLRRHLEGSVAQTPASPAIRKNFSFPPTPTDVSHLPSSSSTSSLVSTPNNPKKELYRHHSSFDFLRNYEQNARTSVDEDKPTGTTGYDNQSFVVGLENPVVTPNQNGSTVEANESPCPSGGTSMSSEVFHSTYSQLHQREGGGTPSTYMADQQIMSNRSSEQGLPQAAKPTSPEERKQWLWSTLSTNMSIIYILMLVIVGIVCYLMDMFSGEYSNISEAFNIYLMTGQISFLAYIHISVRRYIKKISGLLKKTDDGDLEKSHRTSIDKVGESELEQEDQESNIPQEYGFTEGSHGGSLYLKIGATVFCMGHLIFSGLELSSKFVYITHEHESFQNCTSVTDIAMSVMLLIYVFYQLFFAFKFSNLIINKRKVLSQFGIMHAIGSSLCYWIYMIIQETLASLSKKKSYEDHSTVTETNLSSFGNPMVGLYASGSDDSSGQPTLYMGCKNSTQLSYIVKDSAPYLYPFSIEFNILMVGFWILLWENHGKIHKHHHLPSVEVTYEDDNIKGLTSNLTIYVDCHASSRGLFLGLLLSIVAVISIILYFVFSSYQDTVEQAQLINSLSETIILSLMLLTTIIAFYYIRQLDVIQSNISSADDILLYVCLPSVFLYAFFNLVPYSIYGNYIYLTVNILRVLQSILQTALIIDGLRRCSNTKPLQNKKPGREILIFLVVMNVSSWLVMSFQVISTEGNAILYDFYGKEVWTTVSHLTLPLFLFYRFHSSVCLADIWKDAYEPDSHH